MMIDTLPEPLVSADVDLKGFPYTPIFRGRLFASSFHAKVSDAAWRAGVTLWLKSWEQVPAGSLPRDEVELCRLAELGRDLKTWRRIAKDALWGWFPCNDGRLHHKTVAEGVMEAWGQRKAQRDRTAAARAARQSQRTSQTDDRHAERAGKEVTTNNVTTSVTDIVERQSHRPTEAKRSEASNNPEPAAPFDPAAAAAKRRDFATDGPTDEFREAQTACIAALGDIAPVDAHFGPMMLLLDRGFPLRSVVTVLRSYAAKPPKNLVKTWTLWAQKVSDQLTSAPQCEPAARTVPIRDVEVPEHRVKAAVDRFYADGTWYEPWGPPPGAFGCCIPERFFRPCPAV